MAYRVNARFKDGYQDGWLSDVVAAEVPRCGEMISVNRFGRDVALFVTAIWTPSDKLKESDSPTIMVEAREV
jgi:hypothetical protein